eukprot:9463993-Karenia_brevis.AAC.1
METHEHTRQIATLPGRLGGLGLQSAERTSQAAYWASWVDALPALQKKCGYVAQQVVTELERDVTPATACLSE